MLRTLSPVCLVAALVVSVAACERPEPAGAPAVTPAPVGEGIDGGDTVAGTTTSPTTDPPVSTSTVTATTLDDSTTTTAPRTTDSRNRPPTTTSPATTSPTPAPTVARDPENASDLVLAFDGLGSLQFGRADGDVVSILTDLLGAPAIDRLSEYPDDDRGMFVDEAGDESFVAPFGREVCFANGLCAQFGAGSDTALQFIGWRYGGADAAGLATEDGITAGSRWADHVDDMTVRPECVRTAEGRAGGVVVDLRTDGEPFVDVDTDGTESIGDPDPADVVVTGLRAGELPISLDADC